MAVKGHPLYRYPKNLELLLLHKTKVLYIDGFLHSHSLLCRRLLEILACAKLAYGTSLLELSLELLKSSFDIFAFLNRYYNHLKSPPFSLAGAKIGIISQSERLERKKLKSFFIQMDSRYLYCRKFFASPPALVSLYRDGRSFPVCFITSTTWSKDTRCFPSENEA